MDLRSLKVGQTVIAEDHKPKIKEEMCKTLEMAPFLQQFTPPAVPSAPTQAPFTNLEADGEVLFLDDHEQTVASEIKAYEETLAKDYTLDYVINNPPNYAKSGKELWGEAFKEYLRRKKIDPDDLDPHTPLRDVQWTEVTRIYNTMQGKKNRPRSADSVKKKNAPAPKLMDESWWSKLSKKEKKEYIEEHPHSKYAKRAAASLADMIVGQALVVSSLLHLREISLHGLDKNGLDFTCDASDAKIHPLMWPEQIHLKLKTGEDLKFEKRKKNVNNKQVTSIVYYEISPLSYKMGGPRNWHSLEIFND